MGSATVLDGSKIEELVENHEAFGKYVEEKFRALDKEQSGRLSAQELRPAVATIGIALGLPPPGSSPDADHTYDEVLNEFMMHGKREAVGKQEFSDVLSDILLGVADGLRRDPVSLITVDGRLLENYANGPTAEVDAVAVYSEIQTDDSDLPTAGSCISRALLRLTVDQGMAPASDPWVMKNVVEPALESCSVNLNRRVSQAEFVDLFRKVLMEIGLQLKRAPVTVAHSEKTYDGKSISKFLRKNPELEKTLCTTWKSLPKDHHGALPREYLRVGLDILAPAAGLPPVGAVEEMDAIVSGIFKMVKADEGGVLNQKEFSKLMMEILGSIMLQLQGNPISVSSNAVVTDLANSSFLVQ